MHEWADQELETEEDNSDEEMASDTEEEVSDTEETASVGDALYIPQGKVLQDLRVEIFSPPFLSPELIHPP
jgi:hypothetical protein